MGSGKSKDKKAIQVNKPIFFDEIFKQFFYFFFEFKGKLKNRTTAQRRCEKRSQRNQTSLVG
jgi:hypothetical protein